MNTDKKSPEPMEMTTVSQAVAAVASELTPDDVLIDMADMFKVMDDPTRLKILNALMVADELCVGDLTELLNLTQPAVSHHLKALRQSRLVKIPSGWQGGVLFFG